MREVIHEPAVVHESIETEFSLPCSLREVHDSENANTQFWRLKTEKSAIKVDKLQEDNIRLENLIKSREMRLKELEDLNAELLEKAQNLENSTDKNKSTSSSSTPSST
ncbi:hypothetical protein X798_06818 [Onchocerca flexuosa]|uniref:Uncharacterized protein n=1 Tax=Onchocerca flexuosa TaxID=387005 RepID=A0A238BMW5_9BILA|nr:hypothetical protein X798_06818 [Onchocerca flexuosa]